MCYEIEKFTSALLMAIKKGVTQRDVQFVNDDGLISSCDDNNNAPH